MHANSNEKHGKRKQQNEMKGKMAQKHRTSEIKTTGIYAEVVGEFQDITR